MRQKANKLKRTLLKVPTASLGQVKSFKERAKAIARSPRPKKEEKATAEEHRLASGLQYLNAERCTRRHRGVHAAALR